MTEIYLARHPESTLNTDRTLIGGRSNHVPITNNGKRQALAFAKAYTREYPSPDIVFSSPAVRAQALIEAYLRHNNTQDKGYFIDDALQEMTQGVADGKPRAAIYTPKVIHRINEELFDFKLSEGESLNEVADRMLTLMYEAEQKYPNAVLLVATHGQAIRAAVGRLLNWSHYDVTRNPATTTPNVSLTHLTVQDAAITVNFVNKVIIEGRPADSADGVY